jgi:hypothetical protein
MNQFKVQHIIISLDDNAQPRLMSLHIPLDGKIRVHTITPNMSLFAEILNKVNNQVPIIVTGLLVELECPKYYALFPDDKYTYKDGKADQIAEHGQ